ncbi:MAG: hydroxymethylbilane synthase [Thermodesulfovibrionales bacterium]
MIKKHDIRIGTRGSKLALWQAEWVAKQLILVDESIKINICKIKTTGDKILDVPLAKVGGKGLFVKEIEEALLRHDVDIAVHSMKDMPSELPEGLHLRAICKREDVRDAVLFKTEGNPQKPLYKDILELPKGARVGTSSLRRASQILNIRNDLVIHPLRGNLDTRLRKLQEGLYDAIVLASAGLIRLGLTSRIDQVLGVSEMIPAVGQGAIGIECRVDDTAVNNLLSHLNHLETSLCVKTERAFLSRLGGGCQVPIGANAVLEGNTIKVVGFIGSLDGRFIVKDEISGDSSKPEEIGIALALKLLEKGGKGLLDEVYR